MKDSTWKGGLAPAPRCHFELPPKCVSQAEGTKISVFLAQAIAGRGIGLSCDTRKEARAKKSRTFWIFKSVCLRKKFSEVILRRGQFKQSFRFQGG